MSIIFARIYFPTYSNSLKEITKFLGFEWSEPNAAGTQAVVWRHEWEKSHEPTLKQKLIVYNMEDCEGLRRVTNFVNNLSTSRGTSTDHDDPDVTHAESLSQENPFNFRKVQFRLPEFEKINQAAYWDYQREKILVKSSKRLKKIQGKARKQRHFVPYVNKTINWPAPTQCPKCGGLRFYKHSAKSKMVLDIKFGPSSIKRWDTDYLFYQYRCTDCGITFHNSERAWSKEKFGPNLRALSVYENIELGLPQVRVASFLK